MVKVNRKTHSKVFSLFLMLLLLYAVSLFHLSAVEGYYGLGLYSTGGYGGLGLYGLSGLYGRGIYGLGGFYGTGLYGTGLYGTSLYGMGLYGTSSYGVGLYGNMGLSSLYSSLGLGGLYGSYGLYGLNGFYGTGNHYGSLGFGGLYGSYGLGSLYSLGGLNGLSGLYGLGSQTGGYGLGGLGGFGDLRSTGVLEVLTPLLLQGLQTSTPAVTSEQAGTWTGYWYSLIKLNSGLMNLSLVEDTTIGALAGEVTLILNKITNSVPAEVSGTYSGGNTFVLSGGNNTIFSTTLLTTTTALTLYTIKLDCTLTSPTTIEGTYFIQDQIKLLATDYGNFSLTLSSPVI